MRSALGGQGVAAEGTVALLVCVDCVVLRRCNRAASSPELQRFGSAEQVDSRVPCCTPGVFFNKNFLFPACLVADMKPSHRRRDARGGRGEPYCGGERQEPRAAVRDKSPTCPFSSPLAPRASG